MTKKDVLVLGKGDVFEMDNGENPVVTGVKSVVFRYRPYAIVDCEEKLKQLAINHRSAMLTEIKFIHHGLYTTCSSRMVAKA